MASGDQTEKKAFSNEPRRVLNVWYSYGERSEIWLHRLLSNMKRYAPHVLAGVGPDPEQAGREQPWPETRLYHQPPLIPPRGFRNRLRFALGRLIHGGTGTYLRASFLTSLLQEDRFDLLHVHHGNSIPWGPLRRPSLPTVVTFYGSDVFRARGSYLRRLRKLLRKPYAFVATSRALLDALGALGAPRDRIHVIPVGIDVRDFPPEDAVAERRKERRDRPVRLVTVGRLGDVKAPHMLPQVARMLLDRGVELEWTLVGDGPLRRRVADNIERFSVSGCFRMAGGLPFNKVRSLMLEADMLVHNAIVAPDGGREALGVVLIEAGAMGLPVVSCKVGGIPEVVVDRETGMLVEESDMEGMVERIIALARDPELRFRMGVAAMKRARTIFDSARLAERIEELYDNLVVNNVPGSGGRAAETGERGRQ